MAKAPPPKKEIPPKKETSPPPEDDDAEGKKGAEKEARPAKKNTLKLVLVVVASLAVGFGGAYAAMTFLGGSAPAPAPAAPAPAEAEHGAPPAAPQRAGSGEAGEGGDAYLASLDGLINIEFKPFIVNLTDLGGRRMLKLSMSVEADTQELADEINAKMPLFRDAILLLLSSIQSDDIAGLDGRQRLKNQMINRINHNLTRGKIRNLYYSEIVVQ